MSIKSLLVVAWACVIAGAAVASESQRLCLEQTQSEFERLHEDSRLSAPELAMAEETVLIIAQVDVTN